MCVYVYIYIYTYILHACGTHVLSFGYLSSIWWVKTRQNMCHLGSIRMYIYIYICMYIYISIYVCIRICMIVSINWRSPIVWRFAMADPVKLMIWKYPHFRKPPYLPTFFSGCMICVENAIRLYIDVLLFIYSTD